MKTIILIMSMLYAGTSMAAVTLTWEAGPARAGAEVSEWLLWCIPSERTYGAPNILPATQTTYVAEWQEPDGEWKCKVQARSAESGTDSGDAADGSNELFYDVVDRSVAVPIPPVDPVDVFPAPPGSLQVR